MSLGDFFTTLQTYIYENLCSEPFLLTNVIYEVARREKHEVNLYYDYGRKYIYIAGSFYCVSLTLQFFTINYKSLHMEI